MGWTESAAEAKLSPNCRKLLQDGSLKNNMVTELIKVLRDFRTTEHESYLSYNFSVLQDSDRKPLNVKPGSGHGSSMNVVFIL